MTIRRITGGRTGTLWEGRYKSSQVQTEIYLLACTRYIELNHPVRSRTVVAIGDTLGQVTMHRMADESRWMDLDPSYLALANNGAYRRERYGRFVEEGVPEQELPLMREALQRGQPTGSKRFVDKVERIMGCRIEHRLPGLPVAPVVRKSICPRLLRCSARKRSFG